MSRQIKAVGRTEPFKNNLRYYREKAGLSQQRLADLSGVGRTYISECELGISRLTMKMAQRYGAILNVDPNELLGMDAIKYTGTFMSTLKALVYASYDKMVEGVASGEISKTDFNQFMVCFNMVSHRLSEDDAIAINSVVKTITDRLPGVPYIDD